MAERFEIVRVAGTGGMGTVYRARDVATGGEVALKCMRVPDPRVAERFLREADVLASLAIPGVVRYVAHGEVGPGEMFLAMEWLEGEDLAARLAERGITVDESVELARRVAEILAEAHARGVVHRDVKPSNLFLVGGRIDGVTLLDFGIARIDAGLARQTRSGTSLGTPGYMAPEQARGMRELDGRADVFSLGCVLFECLTGAPAFAGEHVMAILAKVLLEDAPPVRKLRPVVGEALESVVAWMLAKDRDARPSSAREVAEVLARLPRSEGGEAPFPRPRAAALTASEQRLLSIVLAGAPPEATPYDPSAPTIASELDAGAFETLRKAIRELGGRLEQLAEGSLLVTALHGGAATDQAARAARCAIAIHRVLPALPIAIATGRGEVAGRVPVGEVIDRAAAVLAAAVAKASDIRVDEVTVGLLDAHFEVGGDANGLVLVGEHDVPEATRTLMGRATPCVGREQEIAMLEALFTEGVDDPAPRVALVTAAAGTGKSRLRFEIVKRLRERHPSLSVWIARGDPMSAGSPFAMIAPIVRRSAGILDGEPLAVRRQKLRARVSRNVPAVDVGRITEFLGELASVPFDDEGSVQLAAARRDATVMGDQMRRAFEDFLDAETKASPLLVVLEDLHWGDLPSVRFVDAALRQLEGRPLLVLALARPEVSELFPRLWADRGVVQIALRGLSKKASEALVRSVLAGAASDELVTSLVDRAGGNALYLEEMIRSIGEGKGDALPDTVLAMVEARLERLAPEARRALRAASVFGQVVWDGGVLALLGMETRTTAEGRWVDELVEGEVMTARPTSRFPGERELVFRHALVREAAYAMLTEHDRKLGHRLAGAWLEARGERDAVVLAEHFERGGDAARAVGHYVEAAAQALEGNDFAAVLRRVERALVHATSGETAAVLHVLQAKAHRWRGELGAAKQAAERAIASADPSAAVFYDAASEVIAASGALADHERLAAIAALLRGGAPPPIEGRRAIAAAHAVVQLNHTGRYADAESLLVWLRGAAKDVAAREPLVAAWIGRAATMRAASDVSPGPLLAACASSVRDFTAAGDLRMACFQRMNLGYANLVVGRWEDAEQALAAVRADAERLHLPHLAASARSYLGYAIASAGRVDEGVSALRDSIAAIRAHGDKRMEARAANYLALTLARAGDLAGAEREAEHAIAACASLPTTGALARVTWAWIALAAGRADQALSAARASMEVLEAKGSVEDGETLLRLTWAEALAACGDEKAAREAIATAHARLLARAATIEDLEVRRSFLERVPENAGTIAAAGRLGAAKLDAVVDAAINRDR